MTPTASNPSTETQQASLAPAPGSAASDTPETEHALHGVWYRGDHGSAIPALCRRFERERDQLRAENKKLRDVAERLAIHAHNHGLNPDASQRNICGRCCAIRDYNQLPHVKERHKE